jgi:hypothetical protein
MYFLSSLYKETPIILGAKPRGGCVYVLLRDGSFYRSGYAGFLHYNQSRCIPGGRYVKVRAMGLCEVDNIHSCTPLAAGHYLVGFYLEVKDCVFVLADDHGKPLVRFCPLNHPTG